MGVRNLEAVQVILSYGNKIVASQDRMFKLGDTLELVLDGNRVSPDLLLNNVDIGYTKLSYNLEVSGNRHTRPQFVQTITFTGPEQQIVDGKIIYIQTGNGNGELV